ncbi:MAG: hypothetical protein K8R36_17985 [Planctomycetales bacterium]|nr:hypothetical protein [Planctomycetales bacterium]
MTAEGLRLLADPDIGADRDLLLMVPVPADDNLIADAALVEVKPGLHYYTAPRSIDLGAEDDGTPRRRRAVPQ